MATDHRAQPALGPAVPAPTAGPLTDPYHWEVQTIESVLPDRVVLDFGLIQPWTAGLTIVLPIVVGRLSDDEGFTWDGLAIGSTSLTFDIDGFRP